MNKGPAGRRDGAGAVNSEAARPENYAGAIHSPRADEIKRGPQRATLARWGSVTKVLFVTTQIAALCWVTVSYLIALYATVRLGEVFPVVELSQQAISTILGVSVLKVVENIFEHNDGGLFGKSRE